MSQFTHDELHEQRRRCMQKVHDEQHRFDGIKGLAIFFGAILMLGGIGNMLAEGLNVFNLPMLILGGVCAEIWRRSDQRVKYYRKQVAEIDIQLDGLS